MTLVLFSSSPAPSSAALNPKMILELIFHPSPSLPWQTSFVNETHVLPEVDHDPFFHHFQHLFLLPHKDSKESLWFFDSA